MAIVVTDKGTATDWNPSTPIDQITKNSVSIVQGATIIVIVAYHSVFGGINNLTWNGQGLDGNRDIVTGPVFLNISSLPNVNAGTGQVVVNFDNPSTSAGLALAVIQAEGMSAFPVADTSAGATGNSSSPSSGSATTGVADDLLVGIVGMERNGVVGGSWNNSFTALHDFSTTGGSQDVCLSTSTRIVNSIASYSASKSGTASQPWAAILAAYRSNITTHNAQAAVNGVGLLSALAESAVGRATLSGTGLITATPSAIHGAGALVNAMATISATPTLSSAGRYRRRAIGTAEYRVRGVPGVEEDL